MTHFLRSALAVAGSAALLAACGGGGGDGGGSGGSAAPPPAEASLSIPAPGSLLPAASDISIAQADCSAAKLGTSIAPADIGEPVAAVTLNAPTWTAAAGGNQQASVQVERYESPDETVRQFLTALKTGDQPRATRMLTVTAQQEMAKSEATIQPPGSSTAVCPAQIASAAC